MAVDFRPDLMYKDIVYCLLGDCPLASSCLRYLAYAHAAPFGTHSFVDPRKRPAEQGCSQYVSNEIQQKARGFRSSMRLVPHGSIAHFRARICHELDCGRSHFYRYASGECQLSREQQMRVADVFAEFGVAPKDGLFDRYDEAYEIPY